MSGELSSCSCNTLPPTIEGCQLILTSLQHCLTCLCPAPQLCLRHCQRQHRRDVHGSGQVPGSQWHVQLHVQHANPHSSGRSSRLGCTNLAPKPIVKSSCLARLYFTCARLPYDTLVTSSAHQIDALQVECDLEQSRPARILLP